MLSIFLSTLHLFSLNRFVLVVYNSVLSNHIIFGWIDLNNFKLDLFATIFNRVEVALSYRSMRVAEVWGWTYIEEGIGSAFKNISNE
jgi:hypothetical protein